MSDKWDWPHWGFWVVYVLVLVAMTIYGAGVGVLVGSVIGP